jgi:hypothetical protein
MLVSVRLGALVCGQWHMEDDSVANDEVKRIRRTPRECLLNPKRIIRSRARGYCAEEEVAARTRGQRHSEASSEGSDDRCFSIQSAYTLAICSALLPSE